MIDLKLLTNTFYDNLLSYCGVGQLVMDGQDIPLKTPRITFKIISPYIPSKGQKSLSWVKVASTDLFFQYDIMETYTSNPTMVISFNFYGRMGNPQNDSIVGKAHEWFNIPELGSMVLEMIGVVISDVSSIQERGTGFIELDREDRRGFDVTFRFEEKVDVRVPTIENVLITNNL
jgi:hypothetical protein